VPKSKSHRCHRLVLDIQKCLQLSSELAETVRLLQWSRQLVPKLRSSDIKRPVAQTSSGPRYDTCDGARRAEMVTGLRRRLARVWEIRQCTVSDLWPAMERTSRHNQAWLVAWYSGSTLVFHRWTFPELRSTYSWRVTTYVVKPSTICRPAN